MVLDYLERVGLYKDLLPDFNFKEAMDFAISVADKPVGRYENGKIFALVQEMDSAALADKPFELHRKYLDVHIVLEGVEYLEYEDVKNLSPTEEYNPDKDIQKLSGSGQAVEIKENMFCLVFPHDGHKPGCHIDKASKIRKIVLKIPCIED